MLHKCINASLQPLLRAELGRVPGLPEQERGRAGQPDQDAARDERTRRLRRSTRQPLSQVIFEPYSHFCRLVAINCLEVGDNYDQSDMQPLIKSKHNVESFITNE